VYKTHANRNIWAPIVCGVNKNSRTKDEPGCQSLFFAHFYTTSENYWYFRKSYPVDLSTGRLLKVGFYQVVRIIQVVIHGGDGNWDLTKLSVLIHLKNVPEIVVIIA
jgi:hypothetical protein